MGLTLLEQRALAHVHRIWAQPTPIQPGVRITCAHCGEYRPHHAKGRCAACYAVRVKQRAGS
jgi:uncharacterized protein (DUF983 family)